MLNGRAHDINGSAELREDLLSNLQLEMWTRDSLGRDENPKATLVYQLSPRSGGYDLSSTLGYGTQYATVDAYADVRHKYDWDLHLQV